MECILFYILCTSVCCSYPEFLNFLEKSQQSAWALHPELAELPAKAKDNKPVIPDPVDELSSETKARLVNKLFRKKVFISVFIL
jgi:hypothetical protein